MMKRAVWEVVKKNSSDKTINIERSKNDKWKGKRKKLVEEFLSKIFNYTSPYNRERINKGI